MLHRDMESRGWIAASNMNLALWYFHCACTNPAFVNLDTVAGQYKPRLRSVQSTIKETTGSVVGVYPRLRGAGGGQTEGSCRVRYVLPFSLTQARIYSVGTDAEIMLPFDCTDVARHRHMDPSFYGWRVFCRAGKFSLSLSSVGVRCGDITIYYAQPLRCLGKRCLASSSHLVHRSSVLVRRRGLNLVSPSRVFIGGVLFWPIGVYIEGSTHLYLPARLRMGTLSSPRGVDWQYSLHIPHIASNILYICRWFTG